MKLAALISHPIQYYAPIFRALSAQCDLHVFFGQKVTPEQQAAAGFDKSFEWDIDLLSGYRSTFLENVASEPRPDRFSGCDTPEIGQFLRRGGFDGLLVMGWYLKSHFQAIWAAKRAGIPVMVRGDSHLGMPSGPVKRLTKSLFFPSFLKCFDAALVVGARNREYWKHYGYPDARMFASPHCVDTDWFAKHATPESGVSLRRKMGISDSTPVALFAGKLIAFKRPGDLIAAAAQARKNGVPVEVLVAGSGPLEADMRTLAVSHNVPLHMLGFCNQSQMPAAYAAADVLVLPSSGRETWGLVANEALACGKPVLISDAVGCSPDLAANGRAGCTFPMGDVVACGQALSDLLSNPPTKADIAQVSETLSIPAATRGIIAAFNSTKFEH